MCVRGGTWTVLYSDETRAGEVSEGWVGKGRKFQEAGAQLGVSSCWSSGVMGGTLPILHSSCVHTRVCPLDGGVLSQGRDWVLLPHLQEMLPPLASQRCGFTMRTRTQTGEPQAWYGWGFCSGDSTGQRPAPPTFFFFTLSFPLQGELPPSGLL